MKVLLVCAAALAVVGCDGEVDRIYYWTIERQGVAPDELQRRHNVMAVHGWIDREDDDLQKTGLYVYYGKGMTPSAAAIELPKVKAELERKP